MESALSRVAAAMGTVYVLVGIAGFAVTGDQHAGAHAMAHQSHLLWFQVNPMHNIAHLVLGSLLVAGATRGAAAARQAMLVVGSVFLVLSLLGPLIMGTSANLVAVNNADHLLHGLTAVVLLVAAAALGRRLQPVS